jgi:hypothetical protein
MAGHRRIGIPWAVLVILIAVGCSAADDGPSGRVGVADEARLRCADAIDFVSGVPDGYGIVGEVAALPTSASSKSALQTSDHGGSDPASRLFAKTGLLVRPGHQFDLGVPEGFQDRVAIGWGNSGATAHRLIVPPCESDQNWLVFAGGISVADPECISLEVTTESDRETFKVGVGVACPGQNPPVGPSDT